MTLDAAQYRGSGLSTLLLRFSQSFHRHGPRRLACQAIPRLFQQDQGGEVASWLEGRNDQVHAAGSLDRDFMSDVLARPRETVS